MRLPQAGYPHARVAALCLLLAWGPANADSASSGKPRIGIELEQERASDHSWRANSMTLAPGIKWDDGWITVLEFLLEVERESEPGAGIHQYGRKAGIRLRKDILMAAQLKGSLRGLLGQAYADGDGFTYAYVEPALKYAFEICEFTVGYRMVRSVDGSKGHDLNKIRLGPSFDLGKHQEIEFRWARSWDAHTGQHASDAYSVELIRKF